jgi:hypothetical protein
VVVRSQKRRKHQSGKRGVSRRTFLLGAGVAGLGAAAGAVFWWPRGGASHAYALAPESALPTYFRTAPPNVREAYRFAIANRDILRQFPCYCGCGSDGHQSNADCYIKDIKPDGTVDFDKMSFG